MSSKPRSFGAATVKKRKAVASKKKVGGSMKLGDFYAFEQCQLKMEARCLMNREFELKDPAALKIWPLVEKLETRNQGKNEKWVPYHTVLGVHENFVVKEIHHAKMSCWNPYRRFVAMFIFRSHCSRDMFQTVQRPYLAKASFWKNPAAAFALKSPLHRDTMKYRKAGNVLQTSCFLIIPERLVDDDDENIVMNLMLRTQRLIGLADKLWPLVNNKNAPPNSEALFNKISSLISETHGMGETWVKMLMVCIDIACPHLKLLQKRCEVGTGAMGGMRQILEDEGLIAPAKDREQHTDPIRVVVNYKGGIVELRKKDPSAKQVTKDIQLLQVTASDRRHAANLASFDRAHAMVTRLAELARAGAKTDKLLKKKLELFKDVSLKVPRLGLEEKQAEALAGNAVDDDSKEEKAQSKKALRALSKLCDIVNKSDSPSCEHFWNMLAKVEAEGRKVFTDLPLIVSQMNTKRRCLSAVTLQVQLCEWRQFQNYRLRMLSGSKSGETVAKRAIAAKPLAKRQLAGPKTLSSKRRRQG